MYKVIRKISFLLSVFVFLGFAPTSIDLSKDGTANSYIVSETGTYRFKTVKGNSLESVGPATKYTLLDKIVKKNTAH